MSGLSLVRFLLALMVGTALIRAQPAAQFYVAPTGSDAADGSEAHPFASLERARAAIRAAPGGPGAGATVILRGGIYHLTHTFVLGPQDSGVGGQPIIYRSAPGETARLMGGQELPASAFSELPRTDPIWHRFAFGIHHHIRRISLPALGIKDFGPLVPRGMGQSGPGALELFAGGRALPLTQWPAPNPKGNGLARLGFATIKTAVPPDTFTIEGNRMRRWSHATEAWAHGYWGNLWSDFREPVNSFTPAGQAVVLREAPPYGIKAGQPFCIYNLPEELNRPGEWYLDRSTGWLYLWPEAPEEPIYASTLAEDLIALRGASGVLLEDLTLEVGRDRLLAIEGGSDNLVRNCTLRDSGRDAAAVSGTRNGLDHCIITDAGESGVRLDGGTRATLSPGGNFVRDCSLRRFSRWVWTYTPGVRVSGVGQVVANNLFADAPHSAILFAGNNHRIELNDIFDVCNFTGDAGAIYGGRHWDYRGNKIRRNFIHDLSSPLPDAVVNGVYLDDCLSGNEVSGNVFYRISGHAIQMGGGRDNTLVNNIMVDCADALATDARGLVRINHVPGSSWNLLERLHDDAVDYQSEPWKSAYPQLAATPDNWAILSAAGSLWLAPVGNVFERNVSFHNEKFIANPKTAAGAPEDRWLVVRENLEQEDPQFIDEAALNLALKKTSPAFTLSGFQPIPFNEIGPH